MKIYLEIMNYHNLHFSRWGAAIGSMLLAGVMLFPCQSHAQVKSGPQPESKAQTQSELIALRALMERMKAEYPRPPRESATRASQLRGDGYWDMLDLNIARYGLMRSFLPAMRSVHPELIRYWVVRTEKQPENYYNEETKKWVWSEIEPDKDGHYKWPFIMDVLKVVSSTPGLSQWADQLQTASDSLIQGVRELYWISSDYDVSREETAAKLRVLDMDGRRLALMKVVKGILGAASEIGPKSDGAWQPLYQFLKQDADAQWNKSLQGRDEKNRISGELSKTHWDAYNLPAAVTAHFAKLHAIERKLTTKNVQLLVSALTPGQTPMAFLEGDAREFLNSQLEFDSALVRALDSPEVRADPSSIRAFDGFYGVWLSLERREDLLRAGRWTQSVGLLMEVARTLKRSWELNELDLTTGRSSNDFAVQRAGQTIDVLNKYRESQMKQGAPDEPLYATVEVDEQGRRVWTHSSWILWKWITASDLDDLKIDGRVVEGLGRRWLLPAGSPIKSIRNLQDVRAADAREVIVGLDPAGAWKGVRKVAK